MTYERKSARNWVIKYSITLPIIVAELVYIGVMLHDLKSYIILGLGLLMILMVIWRIRVNWVRWHTESHE
jgi:hypothetical protein